MIISTKDWINYINKLRRLSDTAAEKMQQYIQTYGFEDTDALIDFAHALVTKYGEGSAELACQMYDAIAEMEGAAVPPAVPAETATIQETARAVQGSLMDSPTGQKLSGVADRLVKQAAADTTLQNAKRDGAEWAWVPMGDTCGFCITLASRGWQRASQAQMRGNHASHIHAHCDCQFSIRFNGKGGVKGYDPDVYKKMYDEAEGNSSAEKVKSLRRSLEDRDKINAQKRAAYARKKDVEIEQSKSIIETKLANTKVINASTVTNPMDRDKYMNLRNSLEQKGIHVIEAVGDDLKYLQSINAEATYGNGYIMHIGAIPSASALYEEIIHSTQARIYGEFVDSNPIELYSREIAANRMLLKNGKSYGFDSTDFDDIKNNLAEWERRFKILTGKTYDESGYSREISNIKRDNP